MADLGAAAMRACVDEGLAGDRLLAEEDDRDDLGRGSLLGEADLDAKEALEGVETVVLVGEERDDV